MSYTVSDARYAKGKKVVRCPSTNGYKTRAAYLAENLGGRYVGRSGGYVMSPAAVAKLERLFRDGWDGHILQRLFVHYQRGHDNLTAAEALKLCEVPA